MPASVRHRLLHSRSFYTLRPEKIIFSLFDRFPVARCHLDAILVLRALLYKQPMTLAILIPSMLSSPLFRSLLALSPCSNGQPRQPKHREEDDPLWNRPQQNPSQRPKFQSSSPC
jgi:hypothetical protein